jgi:hypothetical protein
MVAASLARHGLERPIDPRRLQWSRWFRCDSPHSLLVVPSKPGIFALAEEVMDFGPGKVHVETAAPGCPEHSSADAFIATTPAPGILGGAALQRCDSQPLKNAASAAEAPTRRMLAVFQFSEDDDMAFTLDRMFTRVNPMRERLSSGRCFLRFVVIQDQDQRRSICNALNQWILTSAEKTMGINADFQSSLEFAPMSVARPPSAASADTKEISATMQAPKIMQETAFQAPHLDSGASKNLHCPHPLPSGF